MTDITTLEQLTSVAEGIAERVRPAQIIGLRGELGAGKTTFVKELATAFGIRDDVISPTFVYHQSYALPKSVNGIERLHHFDLYRLASDADLDALGLEVDDRPPGVGPRRRPRHRLPLRPIPVNHAPRRRQPARG